MIFNKTHKTLPDFISNHIISWTNDSVEIDEAELTAGQILLLKFFMWQLGYVT